MKALGQVSRCFQSTVSLAVKSNVFSKYGHYEVWFSKATCSQVSINHLLSHFTLRTSFCILIYFFVLMLQDAIGMMVLYTLAIFVSKLE